MRRSSRARAVPDCRRDVSADSSTNHVRLRRQWHVACIPRRHRGSPASRPPAPCPRRFAHAPLRCPDPVASRPPCPALRQHRAGPARERAAAAPPSRSRSVSSPRCRASRRWPAKRSRAALSSPSTRSTPRAGCSAVASSSWCGATTKSNPAKGVIAARELIFKEKVAVIFGGLDTPVVDGHRADRQCREGAVHGPLGGGHGDHQERRQSELRVPGLGRRRERRHRHAELRAEDLQDCEARAHPRQQPVGRVEREGPEGCAWPPRA